MPLKPICTKCHTFFRPYRNGQQFLEGMPKGNASPGLVEPERWDPYKLWSGDVWQCNGCNAQIIVGTGQQPISEHYMPDFAEMIKGVVFQVNDC